MSATPDPFGLDQNPLGAIRLPQVLTSVAPVRHRKGLSLARVRWRFPRPKAVSPRHLFHPHGSPNFEVSLVAVL